MNEQKLIQNVIEQIKEAQLKLGAEKEVIRLYFPMASMNAILGTNYTDEQEMLAALRTNTVFDTTVLGRLKFFIHEGRFGGGRRCPERKRLLRLKKKRRR